MTYAEHKRKYGRYANCFRITKAEVGYKVVPFNTENAKETTTFVTLLMLEKSDGHFSMEYNSRTASNPGQAIVEVERFRDAAIGWLHTIWNDWLNGRPVDPELKEVFEAIAVDSRELLQQIEGKSRGFTEAEVKDVCADWHEALDNQVGFWEQCLPSGNFQPPSGLKGTVGIGGNA